jgi:hypothetical protein
VEPWIGAISGLGTAIVGLSAVLWRLNSHNGRQNGSIIKLIEQEAEERREFRKEMAASYRDIAEVLNYLKGRLQ